MGDNINASEGQRCFQKAQQYATQGNISQADRLCTKALRMVSAGSQIAKDIAQFQKQLHESSAQSRKPSTHQVRNRSVRRPEESHAPTSEPYDRQLEAKCLSIIRSKDYYEILNVDRSASQEDVKKAYRRLALQFHPDKARCPSAEAAFKQISKAYQCLSNQEAKQHYDTHGFEESETAQRQQQYEAHFMTPEELFESFFHTAFAPRGRMSHTTYTYRQSPNSFTLMQFFPLIVILLLFMVTNFFTSFKKPAYSLNWTPSFNIARSTSENHVVYYTDRNFRKSYHEGSNKLRQLEIRIEMDFFSSECYAVLEDLYRQLQALRFYGTHNQYQSKVREIRAKENSNLKCQKLNHLKHLYPSVYESLRQAQGYSSYTIF